MPTITLAHCQPVIIFQRETPADLAITVSFSGSGTVSVLASPNGVQPPGPASGGTQYSGAADDCLSLRLHYVKTEDGPESVSVTFNYIET